MQGLPRRCRGLRGISSRIPGWPSRVVSVAIAIEEHVALVLHELAVIIRLPKLRENRGIGMVVVMPDENAKVFGRLFPMIPRQFREEMVNDVEMGH